MGRLATDKVPIPFAKFRADGKITQRNSAFEQLVSCENLDDWMPGFSSRLSTANGTHAGPHVLEMTARPSRESASSGPTDSRVQALIAPLADKDRWAGAFAYVAPRDRLGIGEATFLNALFHDLCSPLSAIIGFASMISSSPEASKQIRAHAQEVLDSAARQSSLMDRILDLSRLAADKVPLEEDVFTLTELMAAIASQIEKDRPSKADLVVSEPPESEPETKLCADQGRLVVAVNSALRHTLDRVSEGPILLNCRFEETKGPDGRLAVDVRFSASMGEPGLDQFLAEYYVLLMHGELSVSTAPEHSEFRLRVPVRIAAELDGMATDKIKRSISNLPSAQREALAAAAATCDLDSLMEVLERIRERDEALADFLRTLAQAYSYQELGNLVAETPLDAR